MQEARCPLSISEAEFIAVCDGIQNALFAAKVSGDMQLRVKYHIVWKNPWSKTGQTRHIATKITSVQE